MRDTWQDVGHLKLVNCDVRTLLAGHGYVVIGRDTASLVFSPFPVLCALSYFKKMSDVSFSKSPFLWKGLFCRTWASRGVSKEKTEIAAVFVETSNYFSGPSACVQELTAQSW